MSEETDKKQNGWMKELMDGWMILTISFNSVLFHVYFPPILLSVLFICSACFKKLAPPTCIIFLN